MNGSEWDDRPHVILARVKSALRIAHANHRALALGLYPGLTLADARARVPDLVVTDEDEKADRALVQQIAEWCDRFSPLVGFDGQNGLMLDITGCVHLFGDEAAMRNDVMNRLRAAGFSTRAAVAGTPDCARAVARHARTGVVAPGKEAEAVRPLPTAALGIGDGMVLGLARAGLKTVADVADRPRAPLAARFGADLMDRLARALGEADHPISPNRPPPELMIEQRFAEPVAQTAVVNSVLAKLAEALGRSLERHGLGGRRFEASFFRADGVVWRVAVATGQPLRDAKTLRRLYAERLDALADPLDPGFGFDMIRLAVLTIEPMLTRQAHFDGSEENGEVVAELTDRLSARFGPAHVMRFVVADSHVPERNFSTVDAISTQPTTIEWPLAPRGEPPVLPLRLFARAEPVDVIAEVPDGPPMRFRWRRLTHDIVAAEGPERIAPEWWRDGPGTLTRDYFRVEDRKGRRFWIFREGLYEAGDGRPRWYLHGLFA